MFQKGGKGGSPQPRGDVMIQAELNRLRQENEQLKIANSSTSEYLKGLAPNLEKLRLDVRRNSEQTKKLQDSLEEERSGNIKMKNEIENSMV